MTKLSLSVLKKYESYRTDENKKVERIVIKCYPSTKKLWQKIVADLDAMSYEHALLLLIKMYLDQKKASREEELVKLF